MIPKPVRIVVPIVVLGALIAFFVLRAQPGGSWRRLRRMNRLAIALIVSAILVPSIMAFVSSGASFAPETSTRSEHDQQRQYE